jgi:hypothetical protein
MRRVNGCPLVPRSEWLVGGDRGSDCHGAVDPNDVCPGAYARSEAAREVERVWAWWQKGQLALLYPDGVPADVVEAIEIFESTKNDFNAEFARLNKPVNPNGD